jgi:hypothetical protein
MKKVVSPVFDSLTEDERYDIYCKYNELVDEITQEIFFEFRSGNPSLTYKTIPVTKVRIIWEHVYNYKQVADKHIPYVKSMVEQTSENIIKMWITTYLCGHTSASPDYDFEDNGFDEEEKDKFLEWCSWKLISDYGFPTLNELWLELHAKEDLVHQVITLDKIFNTWHGQGPLADRFVEGGIYVLSELNEEIITNARRTREAKIAC